MTIVNLGNRGQDQSHRRGPNGRNGVKHVDPKYSTSFATRLGRSSDNKHTLCILVYGGLRGLHVEPYHKCTCQNSLYPPLRFWL